MLVSHLPPSLLDTYSLSTPSLWCNVLWIVISFLVLWSICISSSLVHFTKGPEYLTRGTVQVFIPLIRFLLDSFVSSGILVLLSYSFLILSFISTCLMVSASKIPKYLYVSFSPSVLILSWFGSSNYYHDIISYYDQILIVIMIIIKLCWRLEPTWLSLTTRPYGPSLLAGPLDCILCPHGANISYCWLTNTGVSMYRNHL